MIKRTFLAKDPNGGPPITVTIPSGDGYTQYAKVCQDCGASAGGCVTGPNLPPASISSQAVCPSCGGRNLLLVKQEPEAGDGD